MILRWFSILVALPLLWRIGRELIKGNWSTDLIAGVSIVTAIAMEQYPVAWIVMLMLTGGAWLESYAVKRSSRALEALAERVPTRARKRVGGEFHEVRLEEVEPGDRVLVYPHEICPADGVVREGHGSMDESFLTGEPYQVEKAPGIEVISGARNGEAALELEVLRKPKDSRYAQIMGVLAESELRKPAMRRLGDRLGAWYSPIALLAAVASWLGSGDPKRFLDVIVVATPCPLLIAIPVAIIGSISRAARAGIIVRDPAILEVIPEVKNFLFDKTGTLTNGEPKLSMIHCKAPWSEAECLLWIASLERYSKHPLAKPLLEAAEARGLQLLKVEEATEKAGQGIAARLSGVRFAVSSRKKAGAEQDFPALPAGHLECVLSREGTAIASFQFLDLPRAGTKGFLDHLNRKHGGQRLVLVSGDQPAAAEALALRVGIQEVRAGQSPEQKLRFVQELSAQAPTLYMGDGINDAPSLAAATVGVAFGGAHAAPAEAAGAVILEPSLAKVDELLHISLRLRRVLLESVVGGLVLSLGGMVIAGLGYLPAFYGALLQEGIDVLSVLNALRTSLGADPNDFNA